MDWDIKGFVDTHHAARIKEPNDFMSSRTRLRMELRAESGDASAFVSFNLQQNNILKDIPGFELREVYLEYAAKGWDLRVGRQIIIWGKSDGLQITDVISPMDLTEFLARDFDDIRTPVEAVRFRILGSQSNLELVWVPVFKPAVLPEGSNPWAVAINDDIPVFQPETTLGNSEVFGRLSFYLPGIDLAFSGFYTWDDYGVTDPVAMETRHHRVGGLGAEFSMPLGAFVIRGESAFYLGKRYGGESLYKKNALDSLLGVDWYPGNNWSLTAQLVNRSIIGYEEGIDDNAHEWLMTLGITRKFMRETLTLSTFLYMGFNQGDLFNRFSVEYAITDAFHVIAGFDLFAGDSGMFGQYKDNSEFFIKAKYSF